MGFYGKRTLHSFMDEDGQNILFPKRLSFCDHHSSEAESPFTSRSPSVSAAFMPFSPMSPETTWMLSPKHNITSPINPSLLYHCLASLHRKEGNVLSIAVSKEFIFTGSGSKRIHAWKQSRRNSYLFFPRKDVKHKDCISCIAYNHVEKLLYTGSWDKTVKVWKLAEKQCVDSFVAHEGHVNAIVINQQDSCVFTCSSDGSVKIWRRVLGERSHMLTMTLKFQPSPINALALSSSETTCFLYSGSSDGLINFWEKERMSGRYNHGGFLQGHHFAVLCLVAIGDLVLSGSEDTTIRIWRREEGNSFHTCLAVMDGHHGPVRCLAASLEETEDNVMGLLVYSASLDQTFKV